MKLKVRPTDFKVTERLADDVIQPAGRHRVYRVRKEKLTSLEAATELASLTGVSSGDVGMAGLKDRQGVTTQFMSVERGPTVSVQQKMLGIQTVGFAEARLEPSASIGNEFTIVLRDLDTKDTDRIRDSLEAVRENGLPNYFDDQRFGNLRHGQGWIVLDLLKGDISGALRRLIASSSQYEPPARRGLKDALWRSWGHWGSCREIAGKLGRNHSVFEHLKRNDGDFAGAFGRVGTRERLIHLYAFQSHLWNRALALWIENTSKERFGVPSLEGKLRFPRWETKIPDAWDGALMLPGEQLQGVDDPDQRALFEHVLAGMGLAAGDLQLPEVPGFQLKPEPRPVIVHPEGLRIRPAEQDNEFRGRKMLRMSFSLPRGAYATMVIRRLIGPVSHSDSKPDRGEDRRDEGGYRGGQGGGRRRGSRGRRSGGRGFGGRGSGARGSGGRGHGDQGHGGGQRDSGGRDSGGRDSGGRDSGSWGSGERDGGGWGSGGRGSGEREAGGRGGPRRGGRGGRGRGSRSRGSRRR